MFLGADYKMKTFSNVKYDLVHNKIIHTSPPSLKHLSAIKIAISFWYAKPVVKEREYFRASEDEILNDYYLQEEIHEKIPSLTIPETLKVDVALMTELVSEQLSKLTDIIEKVKDFPKKWFVLQNKICWTIQGTADIKRTAEAFADCEDVDLESRFKIALEFYLEEQINALSVQLPPFYVKDNEIDLTRNKYNESSLDFTSLYEMETVSTARNHFGIKARPATNYKKAALSGSNELACQYYWQKLTEQEKFEVTEALYTLYHYNRHPNIFMFYTLQLNEEQKVAFMKSGFFTYNLLYALLDMQWFSFFVDFLNEVSHLLRIEYLLTIFWECIKKMGCTFAFQKKFVPVCTKLIRLYKERSVPVPSLIWASVVDNAERLIAMEELTILEMLFDALTMKERKKMVCSLFEFTIDMLLTAALKQGKMGSITTLLPSLEEREKFIVGQKFESFAVNLISQGCYGDLDRIFNSLFSEFENVDSYKQHFAEETGVHLIKRLIACRNYSRFYDFLQWNFSLNTIGSIYFRILMKGIK